MAQLLPLRNIRFINRLDDLLKMSPVFCAVGALHLPGENGMIALLKARGYDVAPVHFKFLHN
ncbi:MAG: TraB/GumN family protein, partial [Flavobacteriales bacterium]